MSISRKDSLSHVSSPFVASSSENSPKNAKKLA